MDASLVHPTPSASKPVKSKTAPCGGFLSSTPRLFACCAQNVIAAACVARWLPPRLYPTLEGSSRSDATRSQSSGSAPLLPRPTLLPCIQQIIIGNRLSLGVLVLQLLPGRT